MAIFPEIPPSAGDSTHADAIDIAAWAEDAVQAMDNLNIVPAAEAPAPSVRGTSAAIDIPLDGSVHIDDGTKPAPAVARPRSSGQLRRRPSERDSLRRREALLKGKEGSRQRRRWENDRLLNNPWAQPPLPSDWEVHPTYPVRDVPYSLAPLWDEGVARKKKRDAAAAAARKESGVAPAVQPAQGLTREVRNKIKKSKGAKGLLQDIEEQVRGFVAAWDEMETRKQSEGLVDPDSEDEEIVFVGRNGQMNDLPSPRTSLDVELEKEKLLVDSLVDDRGANFGRWLVHSISEYYGLQSWSVTTGNPARRETYVGIKEKPRLRGGSFAVKPLPRPLWATV